MLPLDIVIETEEPNPEIVKIEDTMRITNNTPFREASSGFRKTGMSGGLDLKLRDKGEEE